MRYSVLLSVHDRDEVDLMKTFRQLAKAIHGRDDVEVVIVQDSHPGQFLSMDSLVQQFEAALKQMGINVTTLHYDTVALHPETFHLDTHCNPVAVNNRLMELASGDNLLWLSSDVMVTPLLFQRLDVHLDEDEKYLDTVYCARIFDLDTTSEYCGPSRPFPMMWCVAHPTTEERHDLELLKGFGYDDNDWMARMSLAVGSITIDCGILFIHQTHGRVSAIGELATGKAYSKEAAPGWEKSKAYIQEKWGGNPFDGQTLDVAFIEVDAFIRLEVTGVKNPCRMRDGESE